MNTLVLTRPANAVSRGLWSAVRGRARLAVVGLLLMCAAAGLLLTAQSTPAPEAVPAAPAPAASSQVAAPAPPPAPAAPAAATTTITIHRGDTLWALARRHRTTVADLQALNQLGRSTLIHTGATLHVPATAAPDTQRPARVATPASTRSAKTTPATKPAHPAKQAPAPGRAAVQQVAAAIFGSEYGCAANIIAGESGWNLHATNPHSGAYGLAQALPGSKMARSGPNWRTDAETQLTWMRDYVTDRYGGACKAWTYWQTHHWY